MGIHGSLPVRGVGREHQHAAGGVVRVGAVQPPGKAAFLAFLATKTAGAHHQGRGKRDSEGGTCRTGLSRPRPGPAMQQMNYTSMIRD